MYKFTLSGINALTKDFFYQISSHVSITFYEVYRNMNGVDNKGSVTTIDYREKDSRMYQNALRRRHETVT